MEKKKNKEMEAGYSTQTFQNDKWYDLNETHFNLLSINI